MRKRIVAVVLCCLLLTGCMDVESFLQPPRAQGQQQAVQQALEDALLTDQSEGGYVLKYPVGGNTSAFLMLNDAGESVRADDATVAVAFYAPAAGQHAHVHLLRKEKDGWRSVRDAEGEASDLHRVTLSDLDGDGNRELLVGWNLYSSSYQLSVYRLDDMLSCTADVGRYTEYFVGDMNADGCDEITFLNIGSTVTATLRRWLPSGVSTMGEAVLPVGIRSFEKMLLGKLSNGDDGLYIDALLDSGSYTTTLIYWDGERLSTPLHTADVARIADRMPYVPVMDVDGNGVPEIPVTSSLSADAVMNGSWQWLTEWYSWDVAADAPVRQFGSVVNMQDGYCVELEDDWIPTVTTRYDEQTRTLWLEQVDEDGNTQPFLAVHNTAAESSPDEDEFAFEELPGDLPLEIWYEADAPYRLTVEKISYMLIGV